MRFKVILPVFNQPGYTELCIRYLYATNASFDLTVIDNGSLLTTKALLEVLQKEFQFTLIRYELNLGWAKAINRVLETLEGAYDFIVLLQNDCFVTSEFFARFIDGYQAADPQARVFLPRTNYSRTDQLQIEGDVIQRFSKIKPSNKGLPFSIERVELLLKKIYEDFQEFGERFSYFKKLTYCNVIDSYCLIVERQVFDERIYFDTDFITLGWVEKEWYERVQKAGYEAWIVNNIFVHHHGNLTTDSNGFDYPVRFAYDERLFGGKVNAS